MTWATAALLSAFFTASFDAGIKNFLKGTDPVFLASGAFLSAASFSGVVSLFVGIPPLLPGFVTYMLLAVTMTVFGVMLYYSSLKHADVSLVMPMLAFTPVFLAVSAFFTLGEVPSSAGLAGIILVVVGSYLLHVDGDHHFSPAQPVRSVFKNRYARRTFAAAALFGLAANFDKMAILKSDPYFQTFLTFSLMGITFFIVAIMRSATLTMYWKNAPHFLFLGSLSAIGNIAISVALTFSLAAYVVALRRIGLVFGVIYGNYLFHEKHFFQRILATLVMILGALIITLRG